MSKIKFLVLAVAVSFAGMFSSCYYDYGIDSANSNVVITTYDKTYDFASVNKYILDTTVNKIGDNSLTSVYNSTILNAVRTNLNNLGWTEAAPADSLAAGVVKVGTGITTSTYTVDYNDYYWYGGGYYWGYPYYYDDYTYSYTTGTIIIAIADLKKKDGSNLPLQWIGALNGVTGQTNPNALITSGINQAFSQSPYLK